MTGSEPSTALALKRLVRNQNGKIVDPWWCGLAITGLNMRTAPLHARDDSSHLRISKKPVISLDNIGSSFQRCRRRLGLPGIHWDRWYHFLPDVLITEPRGQSLLGSLHNDFFPVQRFSISVIWAPFLISFFACCKVNHTHTYPHQKMNPRRHLRSHKEVSLAIQPFFINHFRSPSIPFPTAWLWTKEVRTNVLNLWVHSPYRLLIFSDLLYEDSASKLIGTYHFIILLIMEENSIPAINKGGIQLDNNKLAHSRSYGDRCYGALDLQAISHLS